MVKLFNSKSTLLKDKKSRYYSVESAVDLKTYKSFVKISLMTGYEISGSLNYCLIRLNLEKSKKNISLVLMLGRPCFRKKRGRIIINNYFSCYLSFVGDIEFVIYTDRNKTNRKKFIKEFKVFINKKLFLTGHVSRITCEVFLNCSEEVQRLLKTVKLQTGWRMYEYDYDYNLISKPELSIYGKYYIHILCYRLLYYLYAMPQNTGGG